MPELLIDVWNLVFEQILVDSSAPLDPTFYDSQCLPSEVTQEGRRELQGLSHVCRAWRTAITPLLWRNIHLNCRAGEGVAGMRVGRLAGRQKGFISHIQWVRNIWLSDRMTAADISATIGLLQLVPGEQGIEALIVRPNNYTHVMSSSILPMLDQRFQNLRILCITVIGLSKLGLLQPLQRLETLSLFFSPPITEGDSQGLTLPSLYTLCVGHCALFNVVAPQPLWNFLGKCYFPSIKDVRFDLVLRRMDAEDPGQSSLAAITNFFSAHHTICRVGVVVDDYSEIKAVRHYQIPATAIRCEMPDATPNLVFELPPSVTIISFYNLVTHTVNLDLFRHFIHRLYGKEDTAIMRLELCIVDGKQFRWRCLRTKGKKERELFDLLQDSVILLKGRRPHFIRIVDFDGHELDSTR